MKKILSKWLFPYLIQHLPKKIEEIKYTQVPFVCLKREVFLLNEDPKYIKNVIDSAKLELLKELSDCFVINFTDYPNHYSQFCRKAVLTLKIAVKNEN